MYEPMSPAREPHYAQIPSQALPGITRQPLHVVLDNLRSAFNVGSIFRTADAGAVAHIHLCGMTAHPPNKKLEKTALGALDYVPWTHHVSTVETLAGLREQGIICVAIEAIDSAVPHYDFQWPRASAIVFGNEVTGISPEVISQCDATVRIPMRGYKNTINVATAFGVVMYELLRQWESRPSEAGDCAATI